MQGRIQGKGIEIVAQGRTGLKYIEGSTEVYVDGEMGLGNPDYVIFSNCMYEWGDKAKGLSAEEKKRILDNIEAAFVANGLTLLIE
jgi:hypothetical protein